jgi:ankyrin repeat protein
VVEPERFADAVWAGDLPAVEALLAAGADPNAHDGRRMAPLHLAIEQMWVEVARRLVAAGADIHRDSGQGWTPLAHAIDIESDSAWQRHREVGHETTELTELLLAAGAEPTEKAYEVAREYANQKAWALLERYKRQAEPLYGRQESAPRTGAENPPPKNDSLDA